VSKARTKEEKYILAVYDTAVGLGDPEAVVDRYMVGNKIGIQGTSVDNICNQLLQANFLKKKGVSEISLSSKGEGLIETLLQED